MKNLTIDKRFRSSFEEFEELRDRNNNYMWIFNVPKIQSLLLIESFIKLNCFKLQCLNIIVVGLFSWYAVLVMCSMKRGGMEMSNLIVSV